MTVVYDHNPLLTTAVCKLTPFLIRLHELVNKSPFFPPVKTYSYSIRLMWAREKGFNLQSHLDQMTAVVFFIGSGFDWL